MLIFWTARDMGGGVHAFRGGFLGGIVGFLAARGMEWRRGAFRGRGGEGHGMAKRRERKRRGKGFAPSVEKCGGDSNALFRTY